MSETLPQARGAWAWAPSFCSHIASAWKGLGPPGPSASKGSHGNRGVGGIKSQRRDSPGVDVCWLLT